MNKDGGPAFPKLCLGAHPSDYYDQEGQGMTLRDYFAGQMLGVIAQPYVVSYRDLPTTFIAACAYGMADSMLEHRDLYNDPTIVNLETKEDE